jgi:glycosyltransferase involved in cell wall biosynthesis
MDHGLHAMIEPWVFRRVRRIIVPSRGLSRELARTYPFAANKLVVLSNPIDIERMKQPAEFDRAAFRQTLELGADDVALVFIALGQFERKGLPLLLESMKQLDNPRLKLVVVGGTDDLLIHLQISDAH